MAKVRVQEYIEKLLFSVRTTSLTVYPGMKTQNSTSNSQAVSGKQYRVVAKSTWLRPQALELERTEFKSWLFHLAGM